MDYSAVVIAKNEINALFQNDSAVSHQFFRRYRLKTPLEGEKKLMLAVLEDAIVCFLQERPGPEEKKKRASAEAEGWIFEKNDDAPFSFATICETLGLDPMWVRKRLLREKKKNRKKGGAHAAKRSPKN